MTLRTITIDMFVEYGYNKQKNRTPLTLRERDKPANFKVSYMFGVDH